MTPYGHQPSKTTTGDKRPSPSQQSAAVEPARSAAGSAQAQAQSATIENTQVLENIRFLMENTKSDYARREYSDLINQILFDNSPGFRESVKNVQEKKEQRLAERDAKQAAEKAEEAAKEAESNKYLDRLAYITNHYMPELIHKKYEHVATRQPNLEYITKLTTEHDTLSWVVHALHGELDNRVEKHRKDGDLYDKKKVHIADGLKLGYKTKE